MKILVVEDDPDQRELIGETLELSFGPKSVVAAACGQEVLQQDLSTYDIILTDFNLPDMNGIDLLKSILQRCDKPVIVVTGENALQTATLAIRTGAYDYIVKGGNYLSTIPLAVEKNIEAYKLRQENRRLHGQQEASAREVALKNSQLEAGARELALKNGQLEESARELALKNKQLKESLLQQQRMASTDPLTGLYNRRHFAACLEQCYHETTRYGDDLSCIMLDLDGYKKLNDQLGHQFGDKVLQITAKVINVNMRAMDIAARYGGDEFVLLLPHTPAEMAGGVGGRIREEFQQKIKGYLPADLSVSMSMGLSSVSLNKPDHADQLVSFADESLYEAKRAGKDRLIVSQANTVLTWN